LSPGEIQVSTVGSKRAADVSSPTLELREPRDLAVRQRHLPEAVLLSRSADDAVINRSPITRETWAGHLLGRRGQRRLRAAVLRNAIEPPLPVNEERVA